MSEDGYAALAATAAKDPTLQQAMASELATQITALAADSGYELNNTELVRGVTTAYTANRGFPGQFAQANRIAHRWMFTDSVQQTRRRRPLARRHRADAHRPLAAARRSAISTSMCRRR